MAACPAGSESSLPEEVKAAVEFWRAGVKDWYPGLHVQAYFLPPQHFSKVPCEEQAVAGEKVLVVKPPAGAGNKDMAKGEGKGEVIENELRDDVAQQHVLHCLKALADTQREVMMVISQLDFRKYLDGQNDPVRVAAAAMLPKPSSLADKTLQRGDFDILIVHKKFGLIVGEVKALGSKFACLGMDKQEAKATIVNRMKRAVKQLGKSQEVLKHLVKDLPRVKITRTLFLPNITSEELSKALGDADAEVQQEFIKCLEASSLEDAVRLCLCGDRMSPREEPWDATDATVAKIAQWWKACVEDRWNHFVSEELAGKPRTEEEDTDLYEQLLARFCGPATTLEIPAVTPSRKEVSRARKKDKPSGKQVAPRVLGQSVLETGMRLTRITLLTDQVALLSEDIPRLHIVGPPGTGKSCVLYLRARGWLNEGHDVWVVSPGEKSLAASILIHSQLQTALSTPVPDAPPPGSLHFYRFDCRSDEGRDEAVLHLSGASKGGQLHLIVDEALSFWGDKYFNTFCSEVAGKAPEMCLWAASVFRPDLPEHFQERMLTVPLRCPPAVTREIDQAREMSIWTSKYTSSASPAPTDGPQVKWLKHEGQSGHAEGRPTDCEPCGVTIADLLKDLGVGAGEGYLKYSNVLVLCDEPRDDETGDDGHVTPAVGVVKGLKSSGVPVQVVKAGGSEESYRDVALAISDAVTVTHHAVVMGLERMVVVGMGDMAKMGERLKGMSRCTSQLAWVT